jgi:hypothetical protein
MFFQIVEIRVYLQGSLLDDDSRSLIAEDSKQQTACRRGPINDLSLLRGIKGLTGFRFTSLKGLSLVFMNGVISLRLRKDITVSIFGTSAL